MGQKRKVKKNKNIKCETIDVFLHKAESLMEKDSARISMASITPNGYNTYDFVICKENSLLHKYMTENTNAKSSNENGIIYENTKNEVYNWMYDNLKTNYVIGCTLNVCITDITKIPPDKTLYHKLYGFFMDSNNLTQLTAAEVKEDHSTHAITNEQLKHIDDSIYCGYEKDDIICGFDLN